MDLEILKIASDTRNNRPLKNYTHKLNYILPLRPSPNFPNKKAIELYPSLCLLEPTVVSVGRGTEMQFQVYGNPKFPKSKFNWTIVIYLFSLYHHF